MVKKSLVDEQSAFLERMPRDYAYKFGPEVYKDPKKKAQYTRARAEKDEIAQQYFKYHNPHKILPGEHE